MDRKGMFKISNKIVLLYSILFFVIISNFSYFYYNQIKRTQMTNLHDHLLDLINFSVPLIDGDYLELSNQRIDSSNEYHRNISENLNLVKNSSAKIEDIFIVLPDQNNAFIYTVCIPQDNRYGQIYSIDQEIQTELLSLKNEPATIKKVTSFDSKHSQMHGYSPIYNKFGELQGYLVIIFSAENVLNAQKNIMIFLLISLMTFMPIFITLNILFAKKITNPIQELLKGTKRIEKGIFTKKVNIKSKDEFEILGNTFNKMMFQIKNFLDGLQYELDSLAETHKMQASTYKISQATLTTQNLDELYTQIHKTLSEIMDVENFFIALYYQTSNQVEFVFFANKYEEKPKIRIVENNITDLIIETAQSFYLSSSQIKAMQESKVMLPLDTIPIDFIGHPLIVNNKVIGAIATQRYSGEALFTQEDKEFFEFVSNQIALSIDRKRAEETIAQSNNRFSKLFFESPTAYLEIDFSKLISFFGEQNVDNTVFSRNTKPNREFFEACLQRVEVVGVNQAFINLFEIDYQEKFVNNFAMYMLTQNLNESISQILNLIINTKKTDEKQLTLKKKTGEETHLSTRWTLLDYADQRSPSKRAIISFTDITEQKRIEEQLTYENNHDALTGVHNRAFFERESKLLDKKQNKPISVIMADIDKLKNINDNLGHIYGDQAIKNAAKILEKSFRDKDRIARIGGDEFVILLPKTDEKSVHQALKRIIENVKAHNIENNDDLELSLGYSTGGVDKTIAQIINEADMSMYDNKRFRKTNREE